MSERFDFNACWKECMKNAPLQNGIIATDRHEMKDFAEAFFNLGSNYKDRDKEIDQLKAQIEKMKCRGNCGNDFEINNSTSCPLYDFQNVRCPCDKWEMMKCI